MLTGFVEAQMKLPGNPSFLKKYLNASSMSPSIILMERV
jgi:hypothetical protein